MKQSTTDYKKTLSEKLMELGNLCFVGLVFGQVFPFTEASQYNWWLGVLGLIIWVSFYIMAYNVAFKGGVKR